MSVIQFDRTDVDSSRSPVISWSTVRIPIAGLLLVAAVVKAQEITGILAGDGLLSSRPLLLAAIGIEAALAVYLLFGDHRWSWRSAIAIFSVFAVTSGYAWATGQDCNCIDRRIGPGWMLAIDIVVLITAWYARPNFHSPSGGSDAVAAGEGHSGLAPKNQPRTAARILPLSVSLTAGILSITAAQWRHQAIVTADEAQIEYLIPELLIGKRWPLDSRIDPRLKPLETGNWMVVIVRRDCPHCQEFLDKHFADPTWHRPGERTVVFVAGDNQWPFQFDRVELTDIDFQKFISWSHDEAFATSPSIFLIRSGIVNDGLDGQVEGKTLNF